MNKKTNITILDFMKTNFLFFVIGFGVMLILTMLLSIMLVRIKHYEALLPVIKIALICIPSFIASRISAVKLKCLLIPIAFFQGVITITVFVIMSAIANGSFYNMQHIVIQSSYALLTSVIAVFLPVFSRKRHKKHY